MLQNVKDLITTNVGKRVLLVEQRRRRRRHRRRCRQRIFFFFFGSWFVFVSPFLLLSNSLFHFDRIRTRNGFGRRRRR